MINFKVQMTKIWDTRCSFSSCIVKRVSCIRSYHASLITRHAGFTLVELLITMVVFVLAIAAASQIFTGLLTQFKQQSKIAETNIEGIVGLELLRKDLEHAGYGLPWNIPSGTTYSEAASTTICGSADPSAYNDSTTNPPRAIVSGNNNCTNSSDYIVIKAINIATNDPSSMWTELVYCSTCSTSCPSPYSFLAANVCYRNWSSSADNLTSTDLVTVIYPGSTSSTERLLKANSGAFTATSFSSIPSSWLPTGTIDNIRLVYGLKGSGDAPKRPFNRADYYIRPLATGELPRCAPNTGVLEKATMDYSGGFNQLPLLDCVADMQVGFGVDTDATQDGQINCYTNDLANVFATVNAQNIRERVKEIRVYILAHEGQYDGSFTFNPPVAPSSIRVGEVSASLPTGTGTCTGETIIGRNFDLSGIANWQNYRWKVYTIVVKPMDLYR